MLLLLSLFPIKAYAADFDYTDYIVSDSYEDGMNTLQIRIPIDDFEKPSWITYQLRDGSYQFVRRFNGKALYADFSNYVDDTSLPYMIDFFAFYGMDYLELADIPSGTNIRLEFDIDDIGERSYPDFTSYWVLSFYNSEHQLINTEFTDAVTSTFEVNYTETVLNKPAGAVYFTCSVVFRPVSLIYANNILNLRCNAFVFDISIEAMQREQQISGKTNELLEAVNDSLNTTVPGASNSINNSNNAQDRLDQAGDALANVPKPPVNDVNVNIDNYVSADSVVQTNNFFSYLWQSELFMTMIILTFTIGTCSYILFGKR